MQCFSSILEILENNSRHHIGRHYSTKHWREYLAKLYAKAADRFTIQLHRYKKQKLKERIQRNPRGCPLTAINLQEDSVNYPSRKLQKLLEPSGLT